MEESHDMHSKGTIIPPEKTKRKLKTRAQIDALENFYNENNYPAESTKLRFAKQIGLSDKQVSGWLCHRRLKDKRLLQGEGYVNGKHSLSNGAIHDRISCLRPESCSSTKQGDKLLDSKEVESQRFYSHDCSPAVPRSSGSSSASQERLLQLDGGPYAVEPSRSSGVDSRYSYLQPEMENPAFSSVKWKLGRHYREDGPPLSVVFDPLPPGAFDSPIRDSNYDPYYVGDPIQRTSYGIPKIFKEPKVYEKYRCEMLSSGSYPEGICLKKTMQGYHHHNESTASCQLTQKSLITEHGDQAPTRMFVVENSEDSAGKAFDYKSRKNGLKAHTNQPLPYDSYPFVQYNRSEPVFQRKVLRAKFSKSALQTIQPRRPIKKGKIHKAMRTVENENIIREAKTGRKANGIEFRPQDYPMKSSGNFQRRNAVLRYSVDVATSFSEDETAGSTSSVN